VTSRDGTTIRAWRNRGAPGSLPVVISNGLGTPPEAWPSIVGDPARYDAVGWYHRGTAGAPRPADPSHVRVQDHVDDLSYVRVPTTIVAGRWDILASMRRIIHAADEVGASRLVVLRGSHFLPLEQPEEMARLLDELAERARLTVGP